jgi:hypothetical protein
MTWKFDQDRNVACITCRSIVDGAPVLVVTHYEDDHSWAFLDGQDADPAKAIVVSMSTVVDGHPELQEIADLLPGWSATRRSADLPWIRRRDA